ncbi:MAG: thiamine pyrophosphate-dependent dehydrogenase E1 component subunit alpha [Candidatus Actinomarina sp.]|nr:thiamine pyrophosphate-dependent dehydrogenase E1 component subunit alpha [Candidatus Actinomarina sp.]MBL6763000.1 thiamine pyrophosphate-dependent dehydrogenase E1 component subunit alpha [Candidatus Actinomarina sp.]
MAITKDTQLELHRMMMLIRLFEEALEEMFSRGLLHGTMHLSIGQEATAAGACLALQKNDLITSTHRGHGHCLAKGAEPYKMFAELLGREDGYCRGRGGSMHIADLSNGNLGANGIVAGSLTISVGAALSFQMQKKENIILCFFGDGAVNEGSFHEALNLASLWNLPVLFLCENNQYGMSMATDKAVAGDSIASRGTSYGIESIQIDGNDVETVYENVLNFKNEILSSGGPKFIEAVTYRYRGHSKSDRNLYRTSDEIEYWKKEKDPIKKYIGKLIESGISEDQLKDIDTGIKDLIRKSVKQALDSPLSPITNLEEDSYA